MKDPESARHAIYIFAISLAWLFVSVRRPSPANSEIIFGDENIEIVDVPSTPRQRNNSELTRESTAVPTPANIDCLSLSISVSVSVSQSLCLTFYEAGSKAGEAGRDYAPAGRGVCAARRRDPGAWLMRGFTSFLLN